MPTPQRLPADGWATLLLDTGAIPTPSRHGAVDPLGWPGYALRDVAAGEAIVAYDGSIESVPCVLVACDFTRFGGTMGSAFGDVVVDAFDRARAARLPVVTVSSTGGARMQEGVRALAQMVRTTAAANAHAGDGLLQLAVAADPTTGGVAASFLSRADLIVAEEGAYVAFAGPRVVASLAGVALPAGANRAEEAHARGLVDAVLARPALRAWLARALRATLPSRRGEDAAAVHGDVAAGLVGEPRPRRGGGDGRAPDGPPPSAWDAVLAARDPDRPRARDFVARLDDAVLLRGDRCGGVDDGVLAGLGRLHGRPLGFVGQEGTRVLPSGYRTAWRAIDAAQRLGLPLLVLVDTPGADPTAEAGGQWHAIGGTLARLLDVLVPTVALVIGEGGSGGAMALAATDVLLLQETAVFSVIAPEGAAAILHHDAGRAAEVAEHLRLTAADVVALGVGDAVVPDDPDAALSATTLAFDRLSARPPADRRAARRARWERAAGTAAARPDAAPRGWP